MRVGDDEGDVGQGRLRLQPALDEQKLESGDPTQVPSLPPWSVSQQDEAKHGPLVVTTNVAAAGPQTKEVRRGS